MVDKADGAQIYTQYWDGFIAFAESVEPNLVADHYLSLDKHYLGFPCKASRIHFALYAYVNTPICCGLVLDGPNTRRFLLEVLECRERLIAKDLQIDLAYITCSHYRESRRLYVQHSNFNFLDAKTHNAQYDWMLDMLGRFRRYFPGEMTKIYQFLDMYQ